MSLEFTCISSSESTCCIQLYLGQGMKSFSLNMHNSKLSNALISSEFCPKMKCWCGVCTGNSWTKSLSSFAVFLGVSDIDIYIFSHFKDPPLLHFLISYQWLLLLTGRLISIVNGSKHEFQNACIWRSHPQELLLHICVLFPNRMANMGVEGKYTVKLRQNFGIYLPW